MGHNRAGVRRRARLKRQHREMERLAEKAAHAGEGAAREAGAKGAAQTAGGLPHGRSEKKETAPPGGQS